MGKPQIRTSASRTRLDIDIAERARTSTAIIPSQPPSTQITQSLLSAVTGSSRAARRAGSPRVFVDDAGIVDIDTDRQGVDKTVVTGVQRMPPRLTLERLKSDLALLPLALMLKSDFLFALVCGEI